MRKAPRWYNDTLTAREYLRDDKTDEYFDFDNDDDIARYIEAERELFYKEWFEYIEAEEL